MRLPVTYLFVPGNRPERFDKALASGADAVILDLEDAVAAPDKDEARSNMRTWLEKNPNAGRIVVRINDDSTPWFDTDLALVRDRSVRYAMLPKAEAADQIDAVRSALAAEGRVLPIVETARGVENIDAIAAAQGVERLAFGTLDYNVDLDLSGDERGLVYPAARIALASRCAGISPPIAGVTPAIDDPERLLADFAFWRAFGFTAKLCIHPKQVAAINQAMLPTKAEIDWAKRVVAAANAGKGALQVDGKMVDRPVILRAQSILDRILP